MGAWGTGNLESDGAQDTLAGVCDELFSRVMELLRLPRAHEYDDEEIDELFVRMEMIFALSERGMITTAPGVDQLRALFPPYLERWQDYLEAEDEPWPERRKVMEESFDRLAKIAESASSGSFQHRVGLIMDVMSESSSESEDSSGD